MWSSLDEDWDWGFDAMFESFRVDRHPFVGYQFADVFGAVCKGVFPNLFSTLVMKCNFVGKSRKTN